ncbi:MAG: preprotein translocase subunit SecE [Christensenellaceae bacterium]|jgi:preprotein translocase subunit SecE
MAKKSLLGKEKEKQLKEQQKAAKAKNKKKRRSPARFIKDIWSELKKVSWPSRKELISYTGAVIVCILAMAAIAGLFDFALSSLLGLVLSS